MIMKARLVAGLVSSLAIVTGAAQQPPQPPAETAADIAALLEKLHDLLTKGVLTQEEFDAKKAELLKRIT